MNFVELVSKSSVGGIVGKIESEWDSSSSILTINKCINIGDIKGSSTNAYVSGIVGRACFTTNICDSINLGATTFHDKGALSLNTMVLRLYLCNQMKLVVLLIVLM